MRRRFASTLLTLRYRARAASRFVSPVATKSATFCSVGVRPTGPGARPPIRAISSLAFVAQRRAPSCSKISKRPTEGVAREPPFLGSTERLALRQQRPPELEGLIQHPMTLQGPVER